MCKILGLEVGMDERGYPNNLKLLARAREDLWWRFSRSNLKFECRFIKTRAYYMEIAMLKIKTEMESGLYKAKWEKTKKGEMFKRIKDKFTWLLYVQYGFHDPKQD